jgi:glycosyltransferase involved in cell wall biosynthesis
MRRIVYLIDTLTCDTQGTQKQLLETIRRLDRTEWEPHLICLWKSPWMESAVLPCPAEVLGYRGFMKASFPGVVRRLGRLLDELEASVVHAFFDESIIVAWFGYHLSRCRPALVSSRRDMGLGANNQPWYHRLFPVLLPFVNRSYAGIVTNSENVKRYAARREHTPESKFKVIYNGIDIPGIAAAQFRSSRISGTGPHIGIVASLTPVKRHDVLLEAWALLHQSGLPAGSELHILGEGPQRQVLEEQVARHGLQSTVLFHGAVTDISDWLYGLDVGVLCSDREGLSNAILEYMAHGLPVIATAVGGNTELVDCDCGILVPPRNPEALAQALAILLNDEGIRRKLGERSRKTIAESFSWERAMGELAGYYSILIAPLRP